jgi:hypothetical protein
MFVRFKLQFLLTRLALLYKIIITNIMSSLFGKPIQEVESFVYLGSMVDKKGGTVQNVTARIGKARTAIVMLKKLWASRQIGEMTKLRIFNSNVKSVLLYG